MSNNYRFRTHDIIIQDVTTLPVGDDRYNGREVNYWPSGTVGVGIPDRRMWSEAAGKWYSSAESRIEHVVSSLSPNWSVYTGPVGAVKFESGLVMLYGIISVVTVSASEAFILPSEFHPTNPAVIPTVGEGPGGKVFMSIAVSTLGYVYPTSSLNHRIFLNNCVYYVH